MPEPFTIIGLLAAGKAAIAGWLAKEGVDFAVEKTTDFAGDKAKGFGNKQLTQFRDNARLHLRQPDQSIPKSLRLAYLQATLQVCALRGDELGANVTSYSQHLTGKILRWKKRYDESFGVLAQAEVQWLDDLHKWLRAEIAEAKEGKLPLLEITEQDFADLVSFENEDDKEPLRKRLTEHLIEEIEPICSDMPERFRSLLTEGWDQFDAYERAERITWFDCFCVCLQQALAKDPQAREFFQTKLLAGIAHQQHPIDFDQFADALRQLNQPLAALDIGGYFDGLSSQLDHGFDSLHDHLGRVEENVVIKVRGSTTQIIKAQTEQTEILLDAIRDGAPLAEPLPPPSHAEVRRYLQELMERTAELPPYYPQRLQKTDRTMFDEIRQTVQVVKDRARFQQWTEEERKRASGHFDDARRYSPNKARPEMEGYDNEWRGREQPPEPPIDWEKAVAEYPRAVILGDPGFGKSWLLRYEARRQAQQALAKLDAGAPLDDIQLPILTRLADMARAAKTCTVTEALAALASRSAQDDALSAAFYTWVVQHLQRGCCAVLLDAWDEVAETPALPGEVLSRAELAVKLAHFLAPRILLTSRGAGYTGSPIKNAQELELIAFEQNQIEQFAQVWFAGEPDGLARFLSLLKAHPAIRGLARIPMMLSLLSRMFTAKPAEAFPQTRCEIYEQCLRGLLQDWKEEKQSGVETEDADAMLEALSALAVALPIEQGAFKRSFLWQQIQQWLRELRPIDSYYGQQPQTLIRRLLQDGILIKANDERDPDYLFLHRTFHEYLTACALMQRPDWLEQALQKIYDPAWLQVLILLGGRMDTVEQAERYIAMLRNEQCPNTFFNRLKFPRWRRHKDIFFRPFSLAVFAVQELRIKLPEETQKQLFNETLRHWIEPPPWLDRAWFVNLLLSWGKRALPELRALLRDKRVAARVRGEVARALIELQDREALPELLALLHDEQVADRVRGEVARFLIDLQGREALPELCALLRDKRVAARVRGEVARALIELQGREVLPEMSAFLRDKRVAARVRGEVARALIELQDREALPELLALLHDEQVADRLRVEVARALIELQDREAMPELRALLRDERVDDRLRGEVARGLIELRDREALPGLLALLRDERVADRVRVEVARALIELQDREALPELRALLRDEQVDSDVRVEVARGLIELRDREALPELRALLRDERVDSDVRGEVAMALIGLRDREALPELRALLRDDWVTARVRVEVARGLIELKDREALPELLALLRDELVDDWLRGEVTRGLIELKDREALPELCAFLRDERVAAQMRGEVARALIELQGREALPELRALLREEQVADRLRGEVARGLAKQRDREALPELRALLRDEWVADRLRSEVAMALAELQDHEALPELLALLRNERVDDWVRGKFARCLIELQDRRALPELLAFLRDDWVTARVRVEVARALIDLQDREALPELRALLRDEQVDFDVRVEVAMALIELQGREALPELCAFLRDERVADRVRVKVARGLIELRDREALPELCAFLRDEQVTARVRVKVARDLIELQGREALPELRALLRDEQVDSDVRVEVAMALIELRDREALPDLCPLLHDAKLEYLARAKICDGLWKLAQAEKVPIRF